MAAQRINIRWRNREQVSRSCEAVEKERRIPQTYLIGSRRMCDATSTPPWFVQVEVSL